MPALVNTLKNFNPEDDVYLGKPSLIREMEVRLHVCNSKLSFWVFIAIRLARFVPLLFLFADLTSVILG